MKTYIAHTPEQLAELAPDILRAIGDNRIVVFRAPMGAGKTTLIKALCEAIGIDSIVNSPTFAIVNDYRTAGNRSIFHFDLYRLKNAAELLDIGCEEYFASGDYCFIEWPDVAEPLLPDSYTTITIDVLPDEARRIVVG